MFQLESISVLVLLPLVILVYLFIRPAKKQSSAVIVPFYQQLAEAQTHNVLPARPSLLRLILLTSIWILLVIAAARPQWVGEPVALSTSGRDLLLAVDISDSMSQEDMQINGRTTSRLISVKHVVSDFIERRKGDRLGLVLFGSNAYLQTPLTFDTDTVSQFLKDAQLGFAGPQTAIGDAIGLSIKRLKNDIVFSDKNNVSENRTVEKTENTENKVVILLTDGANTAGEVEPLQAAKLAAQTGVKIYTIGIGADEMTVRSFFGSRKVNPSASLDEKTLSTIAETTGGKYFRAKDIKELDDIYRELDQLEPTTQEKEWLRPVKSLFIWPLTLALLLSLLLTMIIYYTAIKYYFIHLFKSKPVIDQQSNSLSGDNHHG